MVVHSLSLSHDAVVPDHVVWIIDTRLPLVFVLHVLGVPDRHNVVKGLWLVYL